MSAIDYVVSTKVSGTVAGTTMGGAILRWMNLIPNDIIVKGSLMLGLLLTLILIILNIQKLLHERKRNRIELERMRVELEEHQADLKKKLSLD